jgi:hypothetical protein
MAASQAPHIVIIL